MSDGVLLAARPSQATRLGPAGSYGVVQGLAEPIRVAIHARTPASGRRAALV